MDSPAEIDPNQGRPAGAILAVENALRLLQIFENGGEIRVGTASRTLRLSRSTIHRLLNTLVLHGFVEQDPTSRSYVPGSALTAIGLSVVQTSDLSAMSDTLAKLAKHTNETAHLAVLRGDQVLYLESIESERAVRTGSRAGWTLPAHATAAGKALLACVNDDEILTIFPNELIAGAAGRPIVARVDLLAELELVRARGYATNDGESEPDVCAVGVALRDRHGRARAAVAVTAPRSRVDDAWMQDTGKTAMSIASGFSRATS